MENPLFESPFNTSRFRSLFLSLSKWGKLICLLGLIYQCLVAAFVYRQYRAYQSLSVQNRIRYYPNLLGAGFELMMLLLYVALYWMYYRGASYLQQATAYPELNEELLLKSFRISLRVMILQLPAILLSIAYSIHLLSR